MIGKKIKVNDYKFTYGQETININLYAAFKNIKNGNKFAIYSYESNNSKLFYGTFFKRNNEAVIMTSKEKNKDVVKEFIDSLLIGEKHEKFEIISLEEIESIEIIDEYAVDFNTDINKLYELTIPKPIVEIKEGKLKKKKSISIAAIFFTLFIIVVISFFFFNPEVILGKNKQYNCTKNFIHKNLPCSVVEELSLTFSNKREIINIDTKVDHIFNDTKYYQEFRDKGYFYQYMEEGDAYKFIDQEYTYRLLSKMDITSDFFLPKEETELIKYYKENNYTCKVVEIDE